MTNPLDLAELRRKLALMKDPNAEGGARAEAALQTHLALPALLDEIERLRDENDRLNFLVVDKGYDKLHEENEQLRAEVERLRGDWRAEKREKLSWMSEASKAMAKCERLRAVVDAARAWREADDRDCCGACCKCLECLEAELVTAIDALDRSRSRSLGIDRFRCCTMMAPTAPAGNRRRMSVSNYLEHVEILAELFRRDTGYMAPGKDIPAALGDDGITTTGRHERYRVWYSSRVLDCALAEILRLRAELENHD